VLNLFPSFPSLDLSVKHHDGEGSILSQTRYWSLGRSKPWFESFKTVLRVGLNVEKCIFLTDKKISSGTYYESSVEIAAMRERLRNVNV